MRFLRKRIIFENHSLRNYADWQLLRTARGILRFSRVALKSHFSNWVEIQNLSRKKEQGHPVGWPCLL
jgi:hypothetical protein